MNDSKMWYQSATLWANIIAVVTALASYFTGTANLDTALPAAGTAIVNILLRFRTSTPVNLVKPGPS